MPITKSAKKALRQNLKRKQRNLAYKRKVKNLLKKIKNVIAKKEIEEIKSLLSLAYKTIDKAVKEKVLKKNTAARKKSRITKLVNSALSQNKENQ